MTTAQEILEKRKRYLSGALSISYDLPLHVVRGRGSYLYDADGREYLDCVNNVAHVGHCHPRVVEAACRQMEELNTNTRFLHRAIVDYAERLAATLPEPLRVCFFVNSGSEANDLALRLARAHTKRREVVAIEGAYHGNTTSLVDISPYKFSGPGGEGTPSHVEVVPTPDPYRGRFTADGDGLAYARRLGAAVTDALDEFYGRAMPAAPARWSEREFVDHAQLYGRHALVLDERGEEIPFDPADWSETRLVQEVARRGGTAWYVVDEAALAQPTPYGTVADVIDRARAVGGTVQRREDGRLAVHVAAAVTQTLGGLRIDERAHVLSEDRTPIPGLFAAGADAGGISTGGYSSGLAAALVFGRIAAETAAAAT
jgi:hypothetical protein